MGLQGHKQARNHRFFTKKTGNYEAVSEKILTFATNSIHDIPPLLPTIITNLYYQPLLITITFQNHYEQPSSFQQISLNGFHSLTDRSAAFSPIRVVGQRLPHQSCPLHVGQSHTWHILGAALGGQPQCDHTISFQQVRGIRPLQEF